MIGMFDGCPACSWVCKNGSFLAALAGGGLLAYLIGAIPFAFLFAGLKGVDIRKVGSGNVGATNVFRSVGKVLGILTFLADALKGLVPTVIFPWLAWRWLGVESRQALPLAIGSLAIFGHMWPVYLGFRGGKGMATGAGVLIGIAPWSVLVGACSWLIIFLFSRTVSMASIIAVFAVAVSSWRLYGPPRYSTWTIPIALTLLAALIVWRHRGNIRRLREGTEHKFALGKRKQSKEQGQS